MTDQFLLGVDIGTYESKGALVDVSGRVIASATVGHGVDMPNPGWAEQDADKVWWHDFVELCQKLLQKSSVDPKRITGIGASAIAPCVLPLDRDGNPLRPGILYGIDTRASEEIIELEQVLGRDRIFENSGVHLTSQQTGPKILWLCRHEPEVWAKTEMLLTASGYLAYKLTGEYTLDYYTATTYAPMLDTKKLCWSEEMSEPIVSLKKLPRLVWTCDVIGKVTYQAAYETGLLEGTTVIAGTADAASEAISVGLSTPGDLMVMYGSSIFFILRNSKRIVSDRFWGATFLEKDTYVVTGGMSTGGSLTRWFRDEFAPEEIQSEKKGGENAYCALVRLAEAAPPGSNGVVLLPYFYGERTPIHDPDARGVIFGLTLNHTRSDLYRAVLESVGYGIRHNIDEMKKEGVIPNRILAIGGGIKNELWMTLVSDIADIEQIIPRCQLGACYGDAFLAGVGAGIFSEVSEITRWVKIEKYIRPNKEIHLRYEPYYRIYKDLYSKTASLMHRISTIQRTQSV